MSLFDYIKPVHAITWEEALKMSEGVKPGEICFLDVRSPEEYDRGHIPGAVLIPLPELKSRIGRLDPQIPIICYCAVGGRSHAAASMLQDAGLKKVYNLKGGFRAWRGPVALDNPHDGTSILDGADDDPKQILLLIWSLEEGSRRFYEKMSDQSADTDARQLFRQLSEVEAIHQRLVSDLFYHVSGLAPDEATPFYTRYVPDDAMKNRMENLMNVEDALAWAKNRPIAEILEFCIRMEARIFDIYTRMTDSCRDDECRAIYARLAEEEKQHLERFINLTDRKYPDETPNV